MAFDANGVGLVDDAIQEIKELNRLRQLAQMKVGDSTSSVLTTAERDAIRTRLLARLADRRDAIKAEVATW